MKIVAITAFMVAMMLQLSLIFKLLDEFNTVTLKQLNSIQDQQNQFK